MLTLAACVSTERSGGYEQARERSLTPAERDVLAAEAEARTDALRDESCNPAQSNRDYQQAMRCGATYLRAEDKGNAIWWWRVAFRLVDAHAPSVPSSPGHSALVQVTEPRPRRR